MTVIPKPPSKYEEWLARDLRALLPGIPFQREYVFAPPRKFRLDFAFVQEKIGVEVQGGIWRKGGGAHSRPANIERDIEKHNLLTANGWRLILCTPQAIKDGIAVRMIEQALGVSV